MNTSIKTMTMLLSVFLCGVPEATKGQSQPDMYVYEYREVVDTLKADSLYAAYKTTLKEKLAEAYGEPILAAIAEIDQLVEHEKSGEKIDPRSPLMYRLIMYAKGNKNVSEKELKTISKGKVPAGFSDKILIPTKEKMEAKIEYYSNRNQPSWDNVFTYHINKYEISYDFDDYQTFNIGNIYGNRTRFVYMERVELPRKKIAIPKPNPDYRDNYFNGNINAGNGEAWSLYEKHTWDESQQSQGWEWVNAKDLQSKTTYFPEERSYKFHVSHPEYRISCNWRDNYCYHPNVYDDKGILVRAGNIVGLGQDYEAITNAVMMAICKQDFLANKYDINKASTETLTALRIQFDIVDALDARFYKYSKMAQEARDNIVAATTPAQYMAAKKKQKEALNVLLEYVAKEREPQAMNYIKQLKSDHSAELKYLYKIGRIDNVTFKLYYLNEQMECGRIAQMKWSNKEPYEAQYEITLLPNEEITIRK